MRIPLPKTTLEILTLTNLVLVKHTADGANSPLTNIVDMANLSAQHLVAQTMYDRRKLLAAQAKQHNEARDNALGKSNLMPAGVPDTVLFLIHKTLNIVKAAHLNEPNLWASWGFDVQTSSYIIWKDANGVRVPKTAAGATPHSSKPAARVKIPTGTTELIALANGIVAKHAADGAASPLNNVVDVVLLANKAQFAQSEDALATQLQNDSETAREARDIAIWGDSLTHTTKIVGSIMHDLTRVQKTLLAIYPSTPHRLGDWGFTVNAPAHKKPKTTPTPPPNTPPNNPGNPT